MHRANLLVVCQGYCELLALGIPRCQRICGIRHNSPDGLLANATQVGPGRQFSALVALPDPVSAATYRLDTQRISSTETATTVGAAQLRAVIPLLGRWGVRSC